MSLPLREKSALADLIARGLQEDLGTHGDLTSLSVVPEKKEGQGWFHCKAKGGGVVAGLQAAHVIFRHVDPSLQVSFSVKDGDVVKCGQVFGTVKGNARSILTAERLVLNTMQRMSAIATRTRGLVELISEYRREKQVECKTVTQVLDTRKTVPGLRVLDKWAVRLGGGTNHRHGLYDMVMIKDNHIVAAGGVSQAIHQCRRYLVDKGLRVEQKGAYQSGVRIEIEAETEEQVAAILKIGGVERIMLDNMVKVGEDGDVDVSLLAKCVKLIDGSVETEASGNVTERTIGPISATGVDYVSVGALTHSVIALDISLKFKFDLNK